MHGQYHAVSRSTPDNIPLVVTRPTVAAKSRKASLRATRATDVTLTQGEERVIGIFVRLTYAFGLPRSLGEIYGLLYATPRPLVFQEIQTRLDLSKGSVSQGLRFLQTVGAVESKTIANDRREHFEAVLELRALVGGFLRERIFPELETWAEATRTLKVDDFKSTGSSVAFSSDELKAISNRIDKLNTWRKRAGLLLPAITKIL